MTNKSSKWIARLDEGNASCFWGLIGMLHFRQHLSTRNLLSDRHYESWRHVGIRYPRSKLDLLTNFKDNDEKKSGRSNSGMPSVRTLMEEEMSKQHCSKKISASTDEWKGTDTGYEVNLEKNHKKPRKDCNSDLHADDLKTSGDLKTCQLNCHDLSKRSFDIDLAECMVKYFIDDNQQHKKHLDVKTRIDSCPSINSSGHTGEDHLDVSDSHRAQNHYVVQKSLGDVAEATTTQKSLSAKTLTAKGIDHRSKEFMDALEILNSNNELFIKLLEDPNSLLWKHIEDLENAQGGRHCNVGPQKQIEGSELLDEVIRSHRLSYKQNEQNLLEEKNKPEGTSIPIRSDGSQSLDKIVVLRPSTSSIEDPYSTVSPSPSSQASYSLQHHSSSGRVSSYFSLKEIRRKLRHAFGESRPEQHLISMDGVLQKISYGFHGPNDKTKKTLRESANNSLASETSYRGEHNPQPSQISMNENNRAKPKECKAKKCGASPGQFGDHRKSNIIKTAHRLYKESVLFEVKKHLAQMIRSRDENKTLLQKHVPRTLWGLLSLQEYNLFSSKFSPGRVEELDLLSEQECAINHSSLKQDSSSSTATRGDNEPQVLDSNSTLLGSQLQGDNCTRDNFDLEGNVQIVEIEDLMRMEENNLSDAPSEPYSNEHDLINEGSEEGSYHASELRTFEENRQPVTLPYSLVITKLEVTESFKEEPERPSPISVLEPFFSGDIVSPGSSRQIEPVVSTGHIKNEKHASSEAVLTLNSENYLRTCIEDKKGKFNYVRTILEASGLCFRGFSARTSSSEQLLDPSLFDVEIASNQFLDDPKLLLDCIGEVLMEIQERLFTQDPWMSFIKLDVRPVPLGENLIQEVWKGIDRYLHSEFQCTLNQLVGRDMDSRIWMDLRFETEGTLLEIVDGILEDLIEETVACCGFKHSFLRGTRITLNCIK